MSNSSSVRPASRGSKLTSNIGTSRSLLTQTSTLAAKTAPSRLKVSRSASSLTTAASSTIGSSPLIDPVKTASPTQPKKKLPSRSPSINQPSTSSRIQPVQLSLNNSPGLHTRNISLPTNSTNNQSSSLSSVTGRRRLSVAEILKEKQDKEEQKSSSPTMSSQAASSQSFSQSPSVPKVRRRLSVMSVNVNDLPNIDGLPDPKQSKEPKIKSARGPRPSITQSTNEIVGRRSPSPSPALTNGAGQPISQISNQSNNQPITRRVFSHFASLSKVGYIPFNPHKVNQDRALEVLRFNQSNNQSLFAVFDGHGHLGHEVSTFLTHEIPRQMTLAINQSVYSTAQQGKIDPLHTAITRAFLDTNTALSHLPHLDCTFSGSTACLCLLINQTNSQTNKLERRLLCANVGDSRAVLGRIDPISHQLVAVALSSDQKPDRPDEKRRVLDCRGRIEPCKGPRGEDIGPPRVWLPHQDVPGLAMTRSFGDLIAASVGVVARPEISDFQLTDNDQFMVIGSDGIWEFMSNEEVVALVGRVAGPNGERAEDAARALVDEATRRWRQEEEVVDDCSAIVVWY